MYKNANRWLEIYFSLRILSLKIATIIIALFLNFVSSQSWVKDQLNDRQINQAINIYNSGRFSVAKSILDKILQDRENINREPAMALLIKL